MNRKEAPRHLIIGGTTKAATTSLFEYLASHPGVCAARYKETRFFLDSDYPVPRPRRFQPQMTYDDLFAQCGRRVRLEATPDYLHSPGTAARIQRDVTDPAFVFVLRHPVERLVSWYRFAKQEGVLRADVSFETYVRGQFEATSQAPAQHDLALAQGRYSRSVADYVQRFGRDRVHVVIYEALKRDVRTEVQHIARFAGLDAGFFDGYEFRVYNATVGARFPRLARAIKDVGHVLRTRLSRYPRLHGILRGIRRRLRATPGAAAVDTAERVVIPAQLREQLRHFYAGENHALQELLGLDAPPWPDLETHRDVAQAGAAGSPQPSVDSVNEAADKPSALECRR